MSAVLARIRRPGPLVIVALLYFGIVSILMVSHGIDFSPDYILVVMVPVALLAGHLVRFLKDWVPFVALFLAWEAMRGIAPSLHVAPHVTDMVSAEKFLFFGHVPTVVLQSWVGYKPSETLGVILSFVYFCHFAFPLGAGLVMWLANRTQFLRYTTALLGMACFAFVVYLLVPTAPPWYAQDRGVLCCFQHLVMNSLPSAVSPYYKTLNPNIFAALPSLHAAFPFLTFLALRRVYPRASLLALLWSVIVWFSVVFLGEHYVIDVIAGVAFASAAWAVMMKLVVPRVTSLQHVADVVLPSDVIAPQAAVA